MPFQFKKDHAYGPLQLPTESAMRGTQDGEKQETFWIYWLIDN